MSSEFERVNRVPDVFGALFLAIAVGMRWRLDFNGPHMDESDYLFVGRRLLEGGTWPAREYVFSSDLPLLWIGLGDLLGGLLGARLLNAVIGLLTLLVYGHFVHRLRLGVGTTLISVGLFAVSAPAVFVSKLATYDAPCLLFFVLALSCAAGDEDDFRPARSAALAGLFFTIAVLMKYVVIAFGPLFALWFFRRRRLLAFALPPSVILGVYLVLHWPQLRVLYEVQIAGVHGPNATVAELLWILLRLSTPCLLLALVGTVWLLRDAGSRWTVWGLWLAGAVLVTYHLRSLNQIAFHKHLVYLGLFTVPLAGAAFVRLTELRRLGAFSSVAVVVFWSIWNQNTLTDLERSFPDVRVALAAAAPALTSQPEVLSEDPYLFRWAAPDVPDERIHELEETHSSESDLLDGLGDYGLVFLTGQVAPRASTQLIEGLPERGYVVTYRQPYVIVNPLGRSITGEIRLLERRAPGVAAAR